MPDGWREVSLGDVVALQRGHDLPAPARVFGPVPVLGSSGISGWHNEAKSPGPGLVIGRSGASIGVATFFDGPFWPLNTALYVTDFKGNDPRWTHLLLKSIDFSAFNSGSAQPSLNRNQLVNIKVLLPPPAEQRRIAGVLGALDDLIQNLTETQMNLELLSGALFGRAAGQTLRRIDEVASIAMGQSPPGSTYNEVAEGLPFHQGIRDFGTRYPRTRIYCSEPSRVAEARDVLLAVRAPIGTTNVALETTAFGRGLAALRSKEPSTLLQALRADANLWTRFEAHGTVFASISRDQISSQLVAWPDESIEPTLALFDELHRQCWAEEQTLRATRDELLPLLMSGKVSPGEVAA